MDAFEAGWRPSEGAGASATVDLTPASDRALRGGSYLSFAQELLAARRSNLTPAFHNYAVGWRCARTP